MSSNPIDVLSDLSNLNNVKDCKLHTHESAFCHVVVHNDGVNLVSYETSVCQVILDVSRDSGYILCNGNYSRSTIKHINWFTSVFVGENMYYAIKAELKKAQKENLNGACLKYIMIPLTAEQISHCDKMIRWYKENAKRFYKYSKEPNYDMLYYGYSRFEATNL